MFYLRLITGVETAVMYACRTLLECVGANSDTKVGINLPCDSYIQISVQ